MTSAALFRWVLIAAGLSIFVVGALHGVSALGAA